MEVDEILNKIEKAFEKKKNAGGKKILKTVRKSLDEGNNLTPERIDWIDLQCNLHLNASFEELLTGEKEPEVSLNEVELLRKEVAQLKEIIVAFADVIAKAGLV